MHRVELKDMSEKKPAAKNQPFLMHRVELKDMSEKKPAAKNQPFLMHRVELKDSISYMLSHSVACS